MLSRRIPLPPNQPPVRPPHQPASALPLHLQRSATVSGHPSQPPSRPGTPPSGPTPCRSSSPFRNRPTSVPSRPQSPGMSAAPIASTHLGLAPADPVDIDLVVRSIPRDTLHASQPFSVACTLGVVRLRGPATHAESRSVTHSAARCTYDTSRNGATSVLNDHDGSSNCSPGVGGGHGHGILLYTTSIGGAP